MPTSIEFGRRMADEASNPLGLTPPKLSEAVVGESQRLTGTFTPQPSHTNNDIWKAVDTYCTSIGGGVTDVNGICRDNKGHGLFAITLRPTDQNGPRTLSIELYAPRSFPSPSFDGWIASLDRQRRNLIEGLAAADRAREEAAATAAQRSLAISGSVAIGTLMCTEIHQGTAKGKFSAYIEGKADGNYQLHVGAVDGVMPGQAFRFEDAGKTPVWLQTGQVFWARPLGWLPCGGGI